MKYIRTKNNVLLQDINNDKYYEWLQTEPTPKDIINQADIIEELCDEFVYCNMLITLFEARNILKNKDYHCKEIYGAIWTDKGLIYVAKTNDEGVLELL